ncbi:MAG: phosphotransferase [Chloroflexi bacterium]|nr:phosphotransferase [Chloroflexota bacterium]
MSIPQTAEDITPEWLTLALRDGGVPGAGIVKSVSFEEIGQDLGFASTISRGTIQYEGDSAGAPATLVAKLPSAHESTRAIVNRLGLFEREAHVYMELGGDLGVPVPELYFGYTDPASNEHILLLEDLSGARLGDQVNGCTLDDGRAVVENLARLHARWWDSARLRDARWLPGPANAGWLRATGRTFRASWRQVSDDVAQRMPEGVREIAERFGPHLEESVRPLGESPATFNHGDCRLGNLFFRDDGVVSIDFQIAVFARGAADLAYFLLWSFPVEQRRLCEDELLHVYHNALLREGVDGYSFETLVEDYRRGMFRNLTIAVVTAANLDFGSETGRATADTLLVGLTALVDWDCGALILE